MCLTQSEEKTEGVEFQAQGVYFLCYVLGSRKTSG